MAFLKTLDLASGVSGGYLRLESYRWDRATREASAVFALYRDADTARSGRPLVEVVAKLRLTGNVFDAYLSAGALASAGRDVLGQLYVAARAEPVISDHGARLFSDALDA